MQDPIFETDPTESKTFLSFGSDFGELSTVDLIKGTMHTVKAKVNFRA